jgi:PhzF family phenazine biosynthesis protein
VPAIRGRAPHIAAKRFRLSCETHRHRDRKRPDVPDPDPIVHRLAAFTDEPAGGNPAGVVITDRLLTEPDMQRIATEVGFSETAFLSQPSEDRRTWRIRYFSPVAEVPFCGHATIAAGVLLGQQVGMGRFLLHPPPGEVEVAVAERSGRVIASLTSVAPSVRSADPDLLAEVLEACGLTPDQLDPMFPAAVAFAGASHLVLVLRERTDLRGLAYDFARVLAAMTAHALTTVAYLWPDPDGRWHARNLFPVGGVVEDPATGAAAAAFGAYLRSTGLLDVPGTFEIVQGEDLGRPSRLRVSVPRGAGGIEVAGTAVPM